MGDRCEGTDGLSLLKYSVLDISTYWWIESDIGHSVTLLRAENPGIE